jgi:hypothetical protein
MVYSFKNHFYLFLRSMGSTQFAATQDERAELTQEDFERSRAKIIKLLRNSEIPTTLQVIADFINQPYPVAEIYCRQICEAGQIQGIPFGNGRWCFIIARQN